LKKILDLVPRSSFPDEGAAISPQDTTNAKISLINIPEDQIFYNLHSSVLVLDLLSNDLNSMLSLLNKKLIFVSFLCLMMEKM
jgi:hypothetical protein